MRNQRGRSYIPFGRNPVHQDEQECHVARSMYRCLLLVPERVVGVAVPTILQVDWGMRPGECGATDSGKHRPWGRSGDSNFDSPSFPRLLTACRASGTSSLVVAWLTRVPGRRRFRPAKRSHSTQTRGADAEQEEQGFAGLLPRHGHEQAAE